jgi:quinol monooxygenase YgiN
MLINAVTYTFPADRADEAAAMLRELRDASLAEPGCLGYEVSRSTEDPRVIVLYETWRDAAALEAHYLEPHFVRLGVNGIRTFAESRVAHKTVPLD